jgi:hypothetical protein
MTRIQRFLALGVLLTGLAAGAAACATSIQKVTADPSRYRNREVTVSGHVTESFSIVGRGAYQIEDETGRLWVFSDHGVPRKGASVKTKGTIREGFDLGPLNNMIKLPGGGIVLVESSHRVR